MNNNNLLDSIKRANSVFEVVGLTFDCTKLYSLGFETINGKDTQFKWFHLTTGDNIGIDYKVDLYYDDNDNYLKIIYYKKDRIFEYDYNYILNETKIDIISKNDYVKKIVKKISKEL